MPVDTLDWIAPELVATSMTEFVDASPASDIWAAAMLTYTLASRGDNPFTTIGRPLNGVESLKEFAADPEMQDFEKRKSKLKLDKLDDQELANLLCHMLHPDPKQRPAAADIIGRLSPNQMPDEATMGTALVELMSAG